MAPPTLEDQIAATRSRMTSTSSLGTLSDVLSDGSDLPPVEDPAPEVEARAHCPAPRAPPPRSWTDFAWLTQLLVRGDIVDGMSESRRRGSWLWKKDAAGDFVHSADAEAGPAPPAARPDVSKAGIFGRIAACECGPWTAPKPAGRILV